MEKTVQMSDFISYACGVIAVGEIMSRHFTKKCTESRASNLIKKWCIWINLQAKAVHVLCKCLCYASLIVLQDIKYCTYDLQLYRTITELELHIQFPVCPNIGVLLSLEILPQVCEKHIQTRFIFSLAISVLEYCYVMFHCIECYLTR